MFKKGVERKGKKETRYILLPRRGQRGSESLDLIGRRKNVSQKDGIKL